MFPTEPSLGSLSVATISDVPRLAVVATSGFYYSPVFAWERTHHAEFPQDTFWSYESLFARAINDPDCIVIVSEDTYNPDESSQSAATIDTGEDYKIPESGSRVIVGVAIWRLEPKSERKGQYMHCQDGLSAQPDKSVYDGGEGRDKDTARANLFLDKYDAAESNYFSIHQILKTLIVHPAYWHRGHGTALVCWGLELASTDSIRQGVIAADMGQQLYLSRGYTKLDNVIVIDETDPGQRLQLGLLEYVLWQLRDGSEV